MRNQREEYISIPINHGVQSLSAVNARLPNTLDLVVLLRMKRRMAEVPQEEC